MSEHDPRSRARGYDDPRYPEQGYPPPPPPTPGYGQQQWGYDQQDQGGYQDTRYAYQPQPPWDPREARAAAKAERAHAKAMRPWYRKKRWWAVGGLVIIIAIAALAGGGGDDGDGGSAATGEPTAGQTDGGQDVYAIGQTAHTGDFDVIVHGVTDPFVPSNRFDMQPRAGFRFVAIELTMTNTGADPLPLSTLAGAELTDHADRLGVYTLAGASELPRIDSVTAAPGEARRGWVVFEVPQDATDLQLRIWGNLTATGSLFDLSGTA